MSLEQRAKRGAKLLEKMLGEDDAAAIRGAWQKIAPEFEAYVTEFLAGEIWSRPGLELKTKSLVTIATLAGMGRWRALELNLRFAAKLGITRQEVVETLLQVAPYAGFPAAWEGLVLARDVYEGME